MTINNLKSKIHNRDACIGIIGLGYVGLPLAIRFSQEGFAVTGFDIDDEKIKLLNAGKSYIKHINADNILAMANDGFKATSDCSKIAEVGVIIICVPTPLGIHNEPDLSYIRSTVKSIKPYLKKNQLLILESTTYPGTTEEEIVPVIEAIPDSLVTTRRTSLFKIGKTFFIGYSPEREDPGNKNYNTKTIPKVVSGYTDNCLQLTETLYNQIVNETVPVSSLRTAEMTKILENIHRAVNIGLVNELKIVAEKMGIDIYEVIKAASTKPFGFTPFYPGPGLGGHCIPIDPFYLTWKAKELGMKTRFIELAGEINTAMPSYVAQKLGEALNTLGQSIKNSKILILGLSYKKNVDDIRESPALALIDLLVKSGAKVEYSDPYVLVIPKIRKYNISLKSKKITPQLLRSFDAILLVTDHDDFDYSQIKKYGKLIIDNRGRFKPTKKIIRA